MSIVQSGLPLALSIPFILAAWIAFLHRQRVTACQETPYPPIEANGVDPLDIYGASADLDAAVREAAAMVDSVACSRYATHFWARSMRRLVARCLSRQRTLVVSCTSVSSMTAQASINWLARYRCVRPKP
jgi:hypothetical protein